ncbi:inositol monophosphatase family protein [Mesorhizobium sp. LHD-90]|uniref:inositol monophosphatase family protein n=1 Tax=Mesorhizobium sp. LHD-90 TaxID=3071414 RepID=UPI0027DF5451|nr:inositol monophosphatase family protein [Mesorhizobium sp. LHD-90]MDQ6433104.1 inositol monophosphatase family protein [Mesorhizobium sp. LHD-90]
MHFDDKTVDWLTALLAEAATVEIMPRWRRLGAEDIRQKTSATDLVTEADVNAERFITARLKERFPTALVVGEEAHAADASVLDGLGDADLAFVIDPVDGTLNFASGMPLFGVMLAVVVKGETVAGIIHDPLGKDFILAVKGGGAFIRHGDARLEPCRVAPPAPVSSMNGAVSWSYTREPERSMLARNQAKFNANFNFRCAAHEYRLLATGNTHFVVYMKLMPWDHLPGTLIHAEAGGYSARLDGSAYLPSHVGGGLLAAPDRESWQEIRRALWAD